MDKDGWLSIDDTLHFHIKPFEGAVLDSSALDFNKIDPYNPLRSAVSENSALQTLFKTVRKNIKDTNCKKAILVGHNATFDHSFIMEAVNRNSVKSNPFHPFVMFDTATLSGLVLGQTVLAKACTTAGLSFDSTQAHSALYDTEITALLFCKIVNRWKQLGGWPLTF
jgi:ribonuclease T